MRTCVANTSPLIALSSIKRLDLLAAICPEVWVPTAVVHELSPASSPWPQAGPALAALDENRWLHPVTVPPSPIVAALKQELGGSGEAEVIAYAGEREIPAFLDELAGRQAARVRGVAVFGSLHVLRLAKRSGQAPRLRPLIEQMLQHGIYFGEDLIDRFLREVGES